MSDLGLASEGQEAWKSLLKKRPTQQRSHSLIEAVLLAGKKLLSEKSHVSVSTNQIASAAGVSVGSFYEYFDNKEDFIEVLLALESQRNFSNFCALAEEAQGLGYSPQILLQRSLQIFVTQKQLMLNLFSALPWEKSSRIVTPYRRQAARIVVTFFQTRNVLPEGFKELSQQALEDKVFVIVGIFLDSLRNVLHQPRGDEDLLAHLMGTFEKDVLKFKA